MKVEDILDKVIEGAGVLDQRQKVEELFMQIFLAKMAIKLHGVLSDEQRELLVKRMAEEKDRDKMMGLLNEVGIEEEQKKAMLLEVTKDSLRVVVDSLGDNLVDKNELLEKLK